MSHSFLKLLSLALLLFFTPFLVFFCFLILLEDPSQSPFFIQKRIGKYGRPFRLFKLRSMRSLKGINYTSTSSQDPRILKSGYWIRKAKLDEIPQLINILNGSMSLVGPRPNVSSDVDLYTKYEQKLLNVLPGITDPSSIIFSY